MLRLGNSLHRQRAEEKFVDAVRRLQKAMPEEICRRLGDMSISELLSIDGVENKAREIENVLESLTQGRTELGNKQTRRKKVGDIIVSWFRSSYPFATFLLNVAKEAAVL